MYQYLSKILLIILFCFSCTLCDSVAAKKPVHKHVYAKAKKTRKTSKKRHKTYYVEKDSIFQQVDTLQTPEFFIADTNNFVDRDSLVNYAKTLLGKKYRYGKADPRVGFDCSGFVMYVYGKFAINLPHSASKYLHLGKTVSMDNVRPGDIIVFTRPGSTNKTRAGHVGIICCNGEEIQFIHASSGKNAKCVTISMLAGSYMKRFIKIVRVLPENKE